MFRTVLLTVAAVAATAEPLRGPAQMQLVALAEEAAFLGKRGLLPTQRWSLDQSSSGRRLHDVDSIPGQGACQFKDGECIVDGKYFAKLGAIADLSVAVQDLDLCTSFDNFDGSCNDFVNPPGRCMTVFMGPVVNGLACVPVNSTADSSDFETGFDIQPSFGSLGNFLDEACPEFSVLEKTSGPICNTTFVALLSILGCRTCISELLEVQGPVADACGAYATLDACTSDEATAAARLVLCGDDPSCARVSPNSVDSGITRPRELSGKRYASYGARYEGRIVQQLIRADGGDGEYVEDAAEGMLGLWGSLLAGKADATWVFMAWEGVLADRKGVKLNAFRLDDYKIPYGYSPVMAVDEASLPEVQPALTKFMAAAACGWNAFVADPEGSAREATQAMNKLFPDLKEAVDEAVMVDAAAAVRDSVLPASGAWGSMEAARWDAFLDWLAEAGLLTAKMQSRTPSDANATPSLDRLRSGDVGEAIPRASISAASLFTNDLLPQASS